MMRSLVILAVTALLAVAGAAQKVPPPPEGTPPAQTDAPTIALGDGTMRGSRLAPYDNAFVVNFTSTKDGTVLDGGIWTDQLRLLTVDGRKVFVRTQNVLTPLTGKSRWSINRFDPDTLAPISSENHDRDGSVDKRTFHGTHVELRSKAGDPSAKEEVRELELPKPAFDFNCCMASLFAATLPLRVGLKAVAPAAVVTKGDDPTILWRVVGREKVRAGYMGWVSAYVVEFPNPGCCYIRFWIIDKPPFMVRMTLTPTPDKPYAQSFDMIGGDQSRREK